jgi:CYTH domain-containing protein
LYPNELRQINIPQFTKAQELLEDKFTFALTKYTKDIINLRGNVFLVNTFNNIIKKLVMSLLEVYYQKDIVEFESPKFC